jgi:lipopolysaccharide biosynthesis regulator YciM
MNSTLTLLLALVAVLLVALLWLIWAWARVRREERDSPHTAYTRGLSALIAGDRRRALVSLREAVQHDSENLDAYIRLGDLLREAGDPAKALAIHRDLTVRPRLTDEDRVRILESLTRDYLAAGRYEEAGQSAERLRRVQRNHPFAHRALQTVAEALEDWPRAIQAVEEQGRLAGGDDKPRRAKYLGWVGARLIAAGDTENGRKRFEEAIKLDPHCLPAHLHLGDLFLRAGEREKAVSEWRALAFQSPENAAAVFERIERTYFDMGQFGEVVRFYRELLHKTSREASVPGLLALAEIHRRKGELDQAEGFVRDALDIDPESVHAHRHLVKLAADRNDPTEALTRLDRLLDAMPDPSAAGTALQFRPGRRTGEPGN